jgi:hypothetical protein
MALDPNDLVRRVRRLGDPTRSDVTVPDRIVAPLRRPLDRAWYARHGRLADLEALSHSAIREAPPVTGPKVLVSSLRMWMQHNAIELVLAHALRMHGADVELITCGGGQPVCEVGWGRRGSPRPCDRCGHYTDRLAAPTGYRLHRLGDEFAWGKRPGDAPGRAAGSSGIDLKGAAHVSAAWLTKSSDPLATADGPAAVRDFEVSGAGVEEAARSILERSRPDVVLLTNGLFASERILAETARAMGIDVVTYEVAPRHATLVFGRRSPAPDLDTDALWESAQEDRLTPAEEHALATMMSGRQEGSAAHERYFSAPTEDDLAIRRQLDIDAGVPIIAAFTNLAWDTAVLGKDLGFESMVDWIAEAAMAMVARPDAVLVIRVHPAEVRWGTAQPIEPELLARTGALPPNVRLVRADQAISSYTLMAMAERVLTYTSTVGLEAALGGRRVAVAGSTHYRGRGFTDDIRDADDLRTVIAKSGQGPLPADQVDVARRYAFAFFFRLMIPFTAVENRGNEILRLPRDARELAPGSDPHLDFVCDRIIDGGELLLPRELALAS